MPIKSVAFFLLMMTNVCCADVVACVLIMEAGGEKDPGMQAVLNVIKNRSKDGNLKEVVLKPYQFSCLNKHTVDGKPLGPIIKKAKQHPKWEKAKRLVSLHKDLPDVTKGADHYHADYIDPPYWADDMERTVKIGRHIFYRSK